MKMTLALVAIMLVVSFNEYGLIWFASYALTGLICWKYEWSRNLMIGCYIVGGFWWIADMAM